MEKNIFVVCPVRLADDVTRNKLNRYAKKLENQGHKVYLPHRDTNQKQDALAINMENFKAIECADEVHVFYLSKSQGIHFDMGVCFALNKKVVVVENEIFGFDKKGYANLLHLMGNKDFCRI